MRLDALPFNWFDVFVLVWLGLGVYRGRKRGMSEELVTFLMWIAIVVVSAFAYRPLGNLLYASKVSSLLYCYVLAYVAVAGSVAGVFQLIKRAIGGKLIGSDAFGKSEYYLGMPAGMLRFVCMLLVGLAVLNARLYSQKEIQDYQKFQKDVYGSEFFPGFQAVQSSIFEKSILGPPIRTYLGFLLIKPTAPERAKEFKQKEWTPPK